MNRHHDSTFKPISKLVGLTLVAAMSAALGCSSSPGSPSGTGGSSTGKGGSTGTAGSAGGHGGSTGGTGGTAGTGGSVTGTGGTAGTAGTGTGGGGTAGTGTGGGGTAGTGTGGGGTGGGTAGAGGTTPPANLPPTLNVPYGATVKFHLHATGNQIYTCTASTAGAGGSGGAGGAAGAGGSGTTTYSFVLKQPDAKLYDPTTNAQVGTHGAGPNWTSTVDGSVVNGAKVYQENSPTAGAIPWLLLRATSNTGTGMFSDVTFVQRVNTTGGVAPATGCDSTTAGTDTPVSYTADYYFYTGGEGAAWTTPPPTPPTLGLPNGATFKIHDHAIGAQVYTCTASAAGGAGGSGAGGAGGTTTYSWVLKQPDAVLYDSAFAMVGTHGLGPNWTSTDGSIVNGAKVFQENAPMSGAIPWLLLHATSNTGTTGVFSDVTYVIRANTAGGVAPASGCDSTTAGMDTRVSYSADYYFFNGGGPGTAWLTPPASLPTAIQVPSGATLSLHDHAIGAQVYTCTASAAGGSGGSGGAGGAGGGGATTYSWVLKQPDAVLYDQSFAMVGTHGMGPNWTSTDGSVVNGMKVAGVNSTATGAIQWLLLMATSNTGTGVFSNITYVQRLNTAGGVAPASGCDSTTAGMDTRVNYSADYYFFTGGTTTTDGGTGG
ncbi:MAG TPA: DUF3455 domain-containing protein [Polyangia bacterium]|nr:DUF3455 domain-containing protein [Polyangia bacterium]